ncbi:unnamed protein product, partial [Ectocarpus sp. 4 AP-2014]
GVKGAADSVAGGVVKGADKDSALALPGIAHGVSRFAETEAGRGAEVGSLAGRREFSRKGPERGKFSPFLSSCVLRPSSNFGGRKGAAHLPFFLSWQLLCSYCCSLSWQGRAPPPRLPDYFSAFVVSSCTSVKP